MTPIKRSAVMFAEGSRTAQPIGVTTNEAAAWRRTPSDIAAARHASSAWNLSVAGTHITLETKAACSREPRADLTLHSERARHCDIRVKRNSQQQIDRTFTSRMEPEQVQPRSRRFRWVAIATASSDITSALSYPDRPQSRSGHITCSRERSNHVPAILCSVGG